MHSRAAVAPELDCGLDLRDACKEYQAAGFCFLPLGLITGLGVRLRHTYLPLFGSTRQVLRPGPHRAMSPCTEHVSVLSTPTTLTLVGRTCLQ